MIGGMDEDLQPKKFAANYPTAGCLIGCAILGVITIAVALTATYVLLQWIFRDFNP